MSRVVQKGSQQCGPFSFGWLECGGHCGNAIDDLLGRNEWGWWTLDDRERLETGWLSG